MSKVFIIFLIILVSLSQVSGHPSHIPVTRLISPDNSEPMSYREWRDSLDRDERKVLDSQAEDVILITIPYHFYQNAGADTYIKKFIISQFEQQVRNVYGLPSFTFTKKAVSPSSSMLNFIGKKP